MKADKAKFPCMATIQPGDRIRRTPWVVRRVVTFQHGQAICELEDGRFVGLMEHDIEERAR